MNTKTTFLLTLSSLLLLVVSCKKTTDPGAPSKTELLAGTSAKTWGITAQRYNGNDEYATACDKDDNYVFKTTNQYEINEGATKCRTADPQLIDAGTWSFQTSETLLKVGDETYKIVELSAQTLRVSLTDGPDTYEFTFTAK